MKATLSYNLNDPDDRMAHLRAVKSLDMASALFEITRNLKNTIEHRYEDIDNTNNGDANNGDANSGDANNGDDLAILEQILTRRFTNYIQEKLPDFIIIDGGLTHLNVAFKVFKELEINIPFISMSIMGNFATYEFITNLRKSFLAALLEFIFLFFKFQLAYWRTPQLFNPFRWTRL